MTSTFSYLTSLTRLFENLNQLRDLWLPKFPNNVLFSLLPMQRGWSGGAMVLGKLPVPGRPTIWIR